VPYSDAIPGVDTAGMSTLSERVVGEPMRIERVVVGVDGSAGSLNAVRWALREARAHGAELHAVFAWQYHPSWSNPSLGSLFPINYGPVAHRTPTGPADPALDGVLDAEAAAGNTLAAAIAEALAGDRGEPTSSGVRITQEVIEGHAAKVLLDAATESDLLVVGSRGHGGFAGALLGSISQHVVTHTHCPVVVVPQQHPDQTGRDQSAD
jgi:nucleotide-binding universal stress UspA family protein